MINAPKVFLTHYLMSLAERTRREKKGLKVGFDWVIYNLGLAKNWMPVRLPFSHSGKTKTEPEFGIDISFLSANSSELFIFVLKDEVLNKTNWLKHNFDSDLRLAIYPDLSSKQFARVKKVVVILAYNKGEDNTGVEIFDRFVAGAQARLKNRITLSFARWNLAKIVEEVSADLLAPALLPQELSGILNYICMQVSDFTFGSNEEIAPSFR